MYPSHDILFSDVIIQRFLFHSTKPSLILCVCVHLDGSFHSLLINICVNWIYITVVKSPRSKLPQKKWFILTHKFEVTSLLSMPLKFGVFDSDCSAAGDLAKEKKVNTLMYMKFTWNYMISERHFKYDNQCVLFNNN